MYFRFLSTFCGGLLDLDSSPLTKTVWKSTMGAKF